MTNPSMFPLPLPYRVQYLPVFIYDTLLRTSLLVTLSSQLIFSILLHIHISNVSNLLPSVWVNVHVSAANSPTLQTKHFIIILFSSRFIFPVNNFFSSKNTFFIISILLRISFMQYPSSDIKLRKYLNWLTCSTCWLQHKPSIYYFPFGLCTTPLSFSY